MGCVVVPDALLVILCCVGCGRGCEVVLGLLLGVLLTFRIGCIGL